jgi:hypothetical protein
VALLAVSCASIRTANTIEPEALARGTYVITAPGHYRLGGNAVAGGLEAGAPAIRVAASGVTLDLGGHTLSMPPTQSGAHTAIEINGVSGVKVTNGALQDITGAGIFLVCDVEPPGKRCANFSFTHLEMRNVGKTGEYGDLGNVFVRPFSGGIVAFGRSTPVPVQGGAWENSIADVTVSEVVIRNDATIKHMFSGSPPAGGQNGFTFASVTNLTVEDTRVSGMTSNDAAACIFLGRTRSVVVRRMNCSGATGDRNANGLDSMSNVPKRQAIKKNYDVRVEDSSFVNIHASGPRANEALGVELNGEKFVFDRLVIADVLNDSTTASGNRAIGIQIVWNSASKEVSYVTNCSVRNVTHHGNGRDSRAGGVSIESAPPIVVRGCSVTNVTNAATSAPSIKSFGYRVDPGANNVRFEGNVSDSVAAPAVASSAKPIAGYVAGFALIGAEVEMRNNRASRSLAGVYARKLAASSAIQDNTFVCNRVGIDGESGGEHYARNRLEGNTAPGAPAELLAKNDNIVAAANCGRN